MNWCGQYIKALKCGGERPENVASKKLSNVPLWLGLRQKAQHQTLVRFLLL